MLALERNRQMELAAESMSLQKQIIDNITIPIAMFDKDCSIMKANAAAAAMMSGATPQDIIGRKCYQALCGCDEPRCREPGSPLPYDLPADFRPSRQRGVRIRGVC